ncbi:Extracellular protein SEL-1 and related proteins [Plasmopara halstedii]|uniref:Extracellular protein SEL-1 and related proteins n=1 Tax=Plasmopara halstedii TaxID=4781 RepID=A0A0P1B632_PLAHL|nr:Extracellular protein SEL-1 and related proteins [Plasmopara halstedii]CEG50285.1 Extracellular protein SEL-1 and related proteins [Plasmopara halstedii]|eukprot:XP_024586654.1 Extracellular protein SEL-1 and related proteins [Plasmopara halstedii]
MASDPSSNVTFLPGLTPATMSPTEKLTQQEDVAEIKKPMRKAKLIFAVAKNVVNASNAALLKKHDSVVDSSPEISTKGGTGSRRSVFGVVKRAQADKPELKAVPSFQRRNPLTEIREVTQQPTNQETQEELSKLSFGSIETDGRARLGQNLVDDVRETLEKLLTELDNVDPRKLLAVRLGAELRGLLGKAQDEFAAYETEFVEHVSNEGVYIALQNFSASLTQVFAVAGRLRVAKFMLNRSFKSEVLFAFQEINSYYTSLFMELSIAIARRSDVDLQLPLPMTPPPLLESKAPVLTGDEICIQAHQHFFGHGKIKNLRKALELYEQAAMSDCTIAMTCLGQMHFAGNGTEKDLLVAEKWFELASCAGDIEACYQMGLLMCEKAAYTKDTQQSSEFLAIARIRYAQAAGQGHRDAQYELGVFHENGRGGLESSEMEAATWYTKAADQGHTGAESCLGRLFIIGTQLQHDTAKAVHFLQRAAAKSDSSAQTRLGLLYTTGNGVKQDLERGVAFLQSAAEAGSSVAMTRLASLLLLHKPQENGAWAEPVSFSQFQDRNESHDEALRLLLNAGKGGHTDAYYALGKSLETSSQLQDQSAALRFYTKAATATVPHIKAAKRVASMYYSAIGCKADKCEAHRFYTIAANAGDAEALNALGLMYEEGDGCDLNYRKAVECYRNAANSNSPHAHFNLGCLLSHGKGVTRNVDAAQVHFRTAMELGFSLAQQFVTNEIQ